MDKCDTCENQIVLMGFMLVCKYYYTINACNELKAYRKRKKEK